MPIAYDSRHQTDAYLLFERRDDITEYIAHKRKPKAKIYGCDYVNYKGSSSLADGVNMLDNKYLTIRVMVVPSIEIKVNDMLYSLRDGMTWKIESLEVQDDGQMKRNSLHARQYIVLNLKG